ncbi:MAG: HAD family hydrolase [Candidatus Sericytochromatia bacterium]
MDFQAVLFDMDGVVVDNMPLHRAVWTEYVRGKGLDPSEAAIRALDGRRAADIIRALFGELTEDEIAERGAEREELYRTRLETAELVLVPGVVDYLDRLGARGVPRVLATSATPGNVEVVLERTGLGDRFEGIVCAADVTRGKPDPEVYLKAAARAGVAPDACLVVEDALPGVRAAKAAGAACLGLMTSEDAASLGAAGADWVARDFTALPSHLM